VKRKVLLALASLFVISWLHTPLSEAQNASTPAGDEQNSRITSPTPAATDAAGQTTKQDLEPARITRYTLSPDRDKKARALSAVRLRMLIVNLIYGLVVLLLVLRWRLAPKFRDVAERASSKRVLQALIFAPLLTLTIDVLSLPTGIYGNWIERIYGLSVQGWSSWFWDWTKGELLAMLLSFVVLWILYSVIRKSPKRWWFYFWLASLPLILALIFLQPLVIDPMFHKFEPLQTKDPALTAELEKMARHAGQDIPPERMFWMGAGEKTTTLNAYVTGFGASKRIVVWDTTIAKMSTPQIVFVAGHEMGHYVLNHIPKSLGFLSVLLLLIFYIGYRTIGWVLVKWGPQWGIRSLDDWASYPALLLLLSIIVLVAGPITSTYSRFQEHQADQYGLEVTHGLTPDSGQVAAEAFNILGDVDLADPDPSPLRVFLFYDHPPIPDRIKYSLSYDPWSKGEQPEFVK
jgi:Zn-dependent protease with chaperone function